MFHLHVLMLFYCYCIYLFSEQFETFSNVPDFQFKNSLKQKFLTFFEETFIQKYLKIFLKKCQETLFLLRLNTFFNVMTSLGDNALFFYAI